MRCENVNGRSTLGTGRKGERRTAMGHSGTTFPAHLSWSGTKTVPAAAKILTTKTSEDNNLRYNQGRAYHFSDSADKRTGQQGGTPLPMQEIVACKKYY